MKFDYNQILMSITRNDAKQFLEEILEWEPEPMLQYRFGILLLSIELDIIQSNQFSQDIHD